MAPRRFVNSDAAPAASASVLGDRLEFRSGKVAQNRFMKAALTEILSTYDRENPKKHGLPTEAILNVYEKWGNGQYGVVLTGNVLVDPTNLESAGNTIIFKEGDSEERRALFAQYAKNIKQDGALAVMQLSHAGRQTPYVIQPKPFSASDIQLTKEVRHTKYGKPIPLTTEQVQAEVIDRFVYAAKFAYESGFDGVQLHAAHGYLLSQFSSPTTNKRTDKYGGSLESRIKVILDIYDAIREAIPSSGKFVIGIKTNSVEFQSEGTTVEDAKEMCAIYEIRPVFKKTIVYLTGGFRTVNAMVEAVQSGATQGIGLGRPTTAEPDLPKKILNGSVTGAIYNDLERTDLTTTALQSGTQMEQMGRTTLSQANNDPCYGISDFSDEATVERYINSAYVEKMQKLAEQGKPMQGTPIFD